MYKLVSTYLLVKSKGCNISGGELMDVLLSIKNIKDPEERQQQWIDQIDTILDRGKNIYVFVDAASVFDNHDYFLCITTDYVLSYVTGYVARKGPRFTKFLENKQAVVCDMPENVDVRINDAIPNSHQLILC